MHAGGERAHPGWEFIIEAQQMPDVASGIAMAIAVSRIGRHGVSERLEIQMRLPLGSRMRLRLLAAVMGSEQVTARMRHDGTDESFAIGIVARQVSVFPQRVLDTAVESVESNVSLISVPVAVQWSVCVR